MKKLYFLILFAFLIGNAMSQNNLQRLVKINNVYKIQYGNDYFNVNTEVVTVKPKTSNFANLTNALVIRSNKLGFIDMQVPNNMTVEEFAQILNNSGQFDVVEYNTFGEYVSFNPNDTYITNQWYLSAINAYQAWDITTGNSNIIVGVLDSGTDWGHPDLGTGANTYQNIYLNSGEDVWTNPNNTATGNHIDDDNNGLVDDWKGWNFANNTNDARGAYYHGTFVAGIVGAKTHNNAGIAGIAGGKTTEGVKMLIYCVGMSQPDASILDDAIIAAVDNGARIIQLSLTVGQTAAIDDAIQYAINNNVMVVCASGNNSSSQVGYPSSNYNVIAVGATNQSNQRANFSNYGTEIDIVAPGVDIYSTTLGNIYTTSSGTSFAAPHVAGVAALVLSVNPNLTGQQVRDIIESTAQKVGGYNYQTMSGHPNGTWHQEMGYGLVNAYAAVLAAQASLLPFDLFVRDSIGDVGILPSGVGVCWTSPDIWVRNSNDNGTQMQNPEYHPSVPNWVYVRVKNRGGIYTNGASLKLYWSKASTALSWDYHWVGNRFPNNGPLLGNIVGTLAVPQLMPNQEIILKFPWMVPNPADYQSINAEPWHFCLLARIESEDDPMTFAEVTDLGFNTRNNNNIAWKNLTVVDVSSNEITSSVAVGNVFNTSKTYELIFTSPSNEIGRKAYEEAEISLKLDDVLANKWKQGGNQSSGVEQKRDNKIIVKGADAVLKNLTFSPNEINTINLTFNFLTKEVSDKENYNYSVILKDVETGEIIGGESYLIKRESRPLFRAAVGDNIEVEKNETFTLSAEQISEEAIYNWYDSSDSLIYEGTNLTTSTQIAQNYKLEVIALADGYKDYAQVSVTLKPNSIKNIYPNPASNLANIEYRLTDAASAYISVINYYNPQISNNYILDLSTDNRNIDLQSFPTGIYVVTLICDGQIADSKILVKQ